MSMIETKSNFHITLSHKPNETQVEGLQRIEIDEQKVAMFDFLGRAFKSSD